MFIPNQNRQRGMPPSQRHGINPFVLGQQQRSAPTPRSFSSNIQEILSNNLFQTPNISKGIDSFQNGLGNLQQVLRLIETTTPFIQEYGPMIKNLPAMYRMMKAFKNIDKSPEEPKNEKTKEVDIEREVAKKEITSGKEELEKSTNIEKTPPKKPGLSTPKLYI